jgi:hypothetical protein
MAGKRPELNTGLRQQRALLVGEAPRPGGVITVDAGLERRQRIRALLRAGATALGTEAETAKAMASASADWDEPIR